MTGDKGWFSSLVLVVTKRYITFGDNGRGCVLSEGEIMVSDKITLRCVALVQSLGYNLLSVSQLLDEGFEVLFRPGGTRILDSRRDLVLTVQNRAQVHRKPTGDLVPFSPRRVLPRFVNPRIGSKLLGFPI
jgi:hypothetical protein